MIVRIVQDQRRQAARARARARAKPAATVRPPGQRRVPRQRIGVKNIDGRIRNRTFKIKRLLVQPKMSMLKNAMLLFGKWLEEGEQYFQQKLERHIIKYKYLLFKYCISRRS